jgi:hypothetical protein
MNGAAMTLAAVIVVFAGIGVLFSKGKGAFLIAGYNTKPKEEKAKYDEVALCKFMGKLTFAICFSMLFWLLDVLYEVQWAYMAGTILFFCFVMFGVAYINTGNRFRKKTE